MEKCRARCGKSSGHKNSLKTVPITHVTNGVHAPTWVAPLLASLFEKHVDRDWASVLATRRVGAGSREFLTGIVGRALALEGTSGCLHSPAFVSCAGWPRRVGGVHRSGAKDV